MLSILFLSVASPSRAAAAFEPGVVTDLTWGINDTQKQKTVAAMNDAGVRWTRLGLGWNKVEPSKGSYSSYNLADIDRAIQLAHDAGVKIILNVVQAPQWASGSTNKQAPPRNPQDLADFMRFIANRYSGTVEAYEIWNEENSSRF
jgi:aryl-phospho-beta-D-glucosidase BglC (GH1 family)